MNKYAPVIGLEVHIELATNSKMFCGCPADHFGKKPNTQTCPVCSALPGALPVPNKKAIEWCVLLGVALNCKINKNSNFDRKHYFYPDLPKGYQISQYDDPFCFDGQWSQEDGNKIGITRIHMEEDTAKLQHTEIDGKKVSLVDFNRSGVPLVELVTEPDFENADKVITFLQELQRIVRYLGISEADMEKGSMRLEANISLRKSGEKSLPDYKVELKNINSFRFLKKAIQFEIERQEKLLIAGEKVTQETRGWNEGKSVTVSQRLKEEAKDYRYFPDPDIPPIELSGTWIEEIKKGLVELPNEKRKRFVEKFALSNDYANILVDDLNRSLYFEEAVKLGSENSISPKTIADAMINRSLDKKFTKASELIKELVSVSKVDYSEESEVLTAIEAVIKSNESAVNSFKAGKTEVVGYLIGQVQKELEGKGDARYISKAIIDRLS